MTMHRRLLETMVLGAWSVLFIFLILTDRTPLYLSSRTDWIVPVGAIILTAATVGRALSFRHGAVADPVGGTQMWGTAALILPVVVIMSLPPASLGAFAASRRTTLSAGGISPTAAEISDGPVTLVDVAGALRDDDAMDALRERAGDTVRFVGFVTRDESDPADTFTLNRFIISCCVADALAVKVRVVGAPAGSVSEEAWVRVTGKVFPLGDEVAVNAETVATIDRPSRPYLDP